MATSPFPDDQWIYPYAEQIRTHANGMPILELGCGSGRDTRRLIEIGKVIALDINFPELIGCRHRALKAMLIQADLAKGLPLPSGAFGAVVASLSIHYFTWQTTLALVQEIRRVMTRGAPLILRVNSTRDHNYGAVGHPEIEHGLYLVDNQTKRFFDGPVLLELFRGWRIDAMAERKILRYEKEKWVWELILYAA